METLTATLLSVIQRVEAVAQEQGYRLTIVRRELAELLNMVPYLRFALVVWLRCRTLHHLKESEGKYLEAMGNEETLLSNFLSEIRGVPLEMVCNGLGMRLELSAGGVAEQFGRMTNPLIGVEHHVILDGPTVVMS